MRNITSPRTLTSALLFSLLAGAAVAAEPAKPAKPPETAKPAEPAKVAAPADAAKVVGPPEVAWKDMNEEQKATYMKKVVVPKMRGPFQEFDAKEFAKFNCATCHGKEAKARKFKMPSPDIHPLPNSPEGFKAMMAKKPAWGKWSKFMGEVVKPQMAGLLGMPEFDPKKPDPTAFSCGRCHEMKKMD